MRADVKAAFVKAPRQAQLRRYLSGIFFLGGCAIYDPALLGDRAGVSGGSSIAATGDGGDVGTGNGAAGSAGSADTRGGGGSGGETKAGAAGLGGGPTPSGGTAAGATEAGAPVVGDGGAMACVPETVSAFCARVGKNCDLVDGADNCGNALTQANCGTCEGFARCAGGGQNNVCGSLTDPALGGSVTASSVGSIGESGSKAFDANVNTKWFGGDNVKTGWIAYQFPGNTSHVVQAYSLTSANDVPTRDPKDWQLQGSNNGGTWTTVDQRSGETFTNRFQTNSYTCSGTTPYRMYRLLISATNGAFSLQLAELVLYGT